MHAKKVYGGMEIKIIPRIILRHYVRRAVTFTPRPLYPRKMHPKRTEQKVGWIPYPVWALGRRQISPAGNVSTIARPSRPSSSRCTDSAIRLPLYSFNDAASNSHYIASNGTVINELTAKGVEESEHGLIYTTGLASASRDGGQ